MKISKITDMPLQAVEPGEINSAPGPYCMSFGFDLTPLISSIKSIGLINPPLVIESGQGRMEIVVGYRRIRALKQLGRNSIPCRILSKTEFSPLDGLLVNFHDNLLSRKLNHVEKGMFLNRLTTHISKTGILEQYMPLLDLPSHGPTLDLFMRIESELDTKSKGYLVQGGLSLKVANMLLDLERESRSKVFHLISTLKLNMNQQKQLIEYLLDLSHIKGESISQLIEEIQLDRISVDGNMNTPQKAKAILDLLRKMRYPRLSKAEKTFKKLVSRLCLPKGVHVSAPPFFETPNYRLEVIFKEGRELKDKLDKLSRNEALKDLGDPWKKDN